MPREKLILIGLGLFIGGVAGYGWKEYVKYYRAKKNKNPNAEKFYTSLEAVIFLTAISLFELVTGTFF